MHPRIVLIPFGDHSNGSPDQLQSAESFRDGENRAVLNAEVQMLT